MVLLQDITKEDLWNLRKEVVLNSLYVQDFSNSFGISPGSACLFFDSWLDDIEERMENDIEGFNDKDFFQYLDYYDNEDCLWEWFCCYEDFSWVKYEVKIDR